ncbi:MAG TPA: hypothetical protein VIF62_12535 [Labilithrix sp.]
MQTAYVFHAKSCALLLDDGGICRWIVMKDDDDPQAATRAQRCVGAQFVATLDPDKEGLLGQDPAVGKHVLFARTDEGRISLVRFGPILQVDRVEEPSAKSAPAPETRRAESPPENEAASEATSEPETVERPSPVVTMTLDELDAEDVVTSVAVEPIDGSENATAPFERSEPTLPSSPALPRLRVRPSTRGILPSRSRLN